ncbi:MAG: UPF0280 family protein [Candidatus Omnitrophota bacterium]
MFQQRTYRDWVKSDDLIETQVRVKETDLLISAECDVTVKAKNSIIKYRTQIEEYVADNPRFRTILKPCRVNGKTPLIIKEMARAACLAGVGPFASVAGAIAEYVGKSLLKYSAQIIVENGGDIFIKTSKDRIVGIYAGLSSLTKKLALKIKAQHTPLGICTSAGTVGHSLSFGQADAVVVLSKSTMLADAAATSIGNLIKKNSDIPKGIKFARKIKGLIGVVIIKGEELGVWGKVEVCRI